MTTEYGAQGNGPASSAIAAGPGRMVFTSGQYGTDAEGNLPEDFATQAKLAFENLNGRLVSLGATFADVVKLTIYVVGGMHASPEYLPAFQAARAPYLAPPDKAPVHSFVGTVALGRAGTLIEIDAIAVLS